MCTAVCYRTKDFYFGRTLDHDFSYAEEITITPRNFPLPFRDTHTLSTHYAIIGMAFVQQDYPLYYDAINEKGLAMAGLHFPGNAVFQKPLDGKQNVAQFEFIPWILSQCAAVEECKTLLRNINLTNVPFSRGLSPTPLHWIIADKDQAITVESTAQGVQVYDNPVGVLTNNPPFPEQLFNLNNFMHLSPRQPENQFSSGLKLKPYSRGMGALGLPGDLSSQSRFVRAGFVKMNSVSGESEEASVGQFFHILGSVEQQRGCCEVADGKYEITIYSSCCNADRGIYYYTTYNNRQISAVDMHREDLDCASLLCFPLIKSQQIFIQN